MPRAKKRQCGPRAKPEDAEMFTLTAQDIHGVIIDDTYGYESAPRIYLNEVPTLRSGRQGIKVITESGEKEYLVRKLTPVECERLQTLPDNYTKGVSNTQRYKCLGNGWTAEVIIHILSHIDIPKDYPIEVLSMYDGIATGRYCLEKLGYTNVKYKAYEIDKYPHKRLTQTCP